MDQESGDRATADGKLSSGVESVAETVIAIRLDDGNDEAKLKGCKKEERFSFRVDVNCDDESQRVCRICHLNAREDGNKNRDDLIELGCGCKGELGFSHLLCAEAWFKLKGNRLCEICGEIAKNVTAGIGNRSFMEEWSDGRSSGDGGRGSRGCRERQSLCNFLMGCLVIAFVLPWFFRVNL